MKLYTCCLLILILGACGKSNDPLANLPLGKLDKEGIINSLESNGLITDKTVDGRNGSIDLLELFNRHHYVLENNQNSYEFSVHFDREKYDFKNQRNIFLRSNDFSENDFKQIISLYSKWYGKPKNTSKGTFEWFGKDKKVIIIEDSIDDYKFYDIKYFTFNYDEENQRIKDSIERHQTIQNLVKIDNPNCRWIETGKYQRKFICDIVVSRGGKYDFRKVSQVKFDLVIMDQFMRDLYIERNLVVSLKNPLGPLDDLQNNGAFYYDRNNNMEFTIEYDKRRSNFHLEEVREYSVKNPIMSACNISQVVMDDGTIIQ